MSNLRKILVLLACRNGANWIEEQLDSILAQQGVLLSILIQDDKSSDSTTAIIARYAQAHPDRIRVFLNEVGTGSAGGNFRKLFARADLSATDYVALADQDDIWHPDKLIRAVSAIEHSGARGYSAAVTAFWEDGRESILAQSPHTRALDFIYEGAGQGCTFLLPVAEFLQVQEFCRQHESLLAGFHFHDWLIYILVRSAGSKWYFDAQPAMRYRQHESNDMGARGGLHGVRRRIALIRQGWYIKQLRIALEIYRLAGGRDALALSMTDLLEGKPSLLRKCRLAWLTALHGRRRFSDRAALTAFVIAGWF